MILTIPNLLIWRCLVKKSLDGGPVEGGWASIQFLDRRDRYGLSLGVLATPSSNSVCQTVVALLTREFNFAQEGNLLQKVNPEQILVLK